MPVGSDLAKISIFLFLLRVFPKSVRPVTACVLYIGIAICVIYYLTYIIYASIIAAPQLSTGGGAIEVNLGYVPGAFNMAADFCALFIGIVSVCGLKMSWKRKLGMIAVFSTGVV